MSKVPASNEHLVLSVKDLTVRLRIGNRILTVVDKIGFNLYHGKTLALVGESGCGKSMTALSLMQILPHPPALPLEGQVIYKGQNLVGLKQEEMRQIRGSKIAMIFQDPMSCLNPVYSIGYQLVEVAGFHLGLYGAEALIKCKEALEAVGVSAARLNDYPHQLSGGTKQRVMIAMALMCEPDVLIADEPTTALDVTIQAQVLRLIKHLQQKNGMAVLLITHDMGVVAEMADEVIVMYLAQGIERGDIEDIFDHRAHPYTKGLFNSRPSVQSHKSKLKSIRGNVPPLGDIPTGCRFHPRCPFIMKKCQHGPVPDFIINDKPTHVAKCWLYDGSEESQWRFQHSDEDT